MSELSPQRKKVVLLFAGVACMSGLLPVLMQRHRILGFVWLGVMLISLVFGIAAFAKLRREEG